MIALMISSELDCACRRPRPELLELFCCCCAPVRVCVSVFSSATTAACHYHPALLIIGATWPVEVHLGVDSHLRGCPAQVLNWFTVSKIRSLTSVALGRLLISTSYNVFFDSCESARKNALTSFEKHLCNSTVAAARNSSRSTQSAPVGTCRCRLH